MKANILEAEEMARALHRCLKAHPTPFAGGLQTALVRTCAGHPRGGCREPSSAFQRLPPLAELLGFVS